MNKDNAKEFLPLVQALADGKVIEELTSQGTWETTDWLSFQRPHTCYRIQPERKWYRVYMMHGVPLLCTDAWHEAVLTNKDEVSWLTLRSYY